MHGAARARIGEAHVLEFDRGRQRLVEPPGRCVGDAGLVVQDAVDALRGREADHALVQHGAQLAHRPEDFDSQHQDDEQGGKRERARLDPRCAVDQSGRRTAGDRGVGDAARQRVGAQHPHGAAEEVARLDLELVGARLALAERLQGRQPLDRIEELGGEGGIGLLPVHRVSDVELVPQAGREQRHQGEAQHDQRHRQVDEGHDGEDQQRREERDQELRQELAEIGFELLDAVDHGQVSARPNAGGRPCPAQARRCGRRAYGAVPSAPVPPSRAPPPRANARRCRAAPSPGRSAGWTAPARPGCGRRRPGRSASLRDPGGRHPARRTEGQWRRRRRSARARPW